MPACVPPMSKAGHRYTTRSDTETILHSYEQYGPECVLRLRGDVRLCHLGQERTQTLLCPRPPRQEALVLLLGRPHIRLRQRDQGAARTPFHLAQIQKNRSLPEYLAFGYVSDDRTLFRGIRKLMPGTSPHARSLPRRRPSRTSANIGRFRIPSPRRAVIPPGSPNAAIAWNRPLRMRLMSDVPLGMFSPAASILPPLPLS